MADTELWSQLARHWHENNNAANLGALPSAIADFEERYQVVMPTEVRAYFEAMDGQREELGTDFFGFWPLAKVRLVSEELNDIHLDRFDFPGGFVFADYLCWSWGYAVEMGSSSEIGGAVYFIGGGAPNRLLASSFSEFIRAYVTDSNSVI